MDSKKSVHIDGRAGCGKTTLIKMLQNEMTQRDIQYKSLAPTNKACRLINGETMHRFAAIANGSYIRETQIKYIFIDEVSMMPELFYKFFIVLKRMRPDIKFIIAGDFAQLLPVKDRIENCNYKNSLALNELCDGNRLELIKCRRSDATLYNLLLPENINKIKKSDFKNEMTSRHICFTNEKRIAINKLMMDQVVKQKKIKPLEIKKLSYDPNSQDVKLCAGMPIIARRNSKDLNIYNNETFTIKMIKRTEEIIIIVDEDREQEIPIAEFIKMFNVAYCITCHKSQGATFDEPYSIHEFNQFDSRLRYVALSRATDKNLINII
jgi:ATP-dependent exoDNAse (exonuclease V) alpha subunit